ncbi:MAG: molybdenum cofactor biosynthesis protein MoaE [Planctomycetota bacterium]|nr:molybdenum cofactor biosynthesis protein MoaE [Planctomycetota bacterium]
MSDAPAAFDLDVRLFAVLRERAGADVVRVLQLPEGSTTEDLKRLMEEQNPALGDLSFASVVLGDEYAKADRRLHPGDLVAMLPPVSGGAPGTTVEDGVFELSAGPIDPAALQARVASPACGAIVLFTGTTREVNRGQEVSRLDYEAFEEMAGPEMRRIFSDCRAAHGLEAPQGPGEGGEVDRTLRMLCVHRTGVVGVGEPSVVIAVASPHRDAAFLAARFLIDTLKERLPVWKKEVYRAGHHWIGDRS